MRFSQMFQSIKKQFYNILICSAICFISTTLTAREFTIISLDNFGKIEAIKFQDESASQTLSVKQFYPNRSFPVPKNNLLHFYGINTDTGTSSKRPLFRISFNNQERDSIIFITRDEDDPEKINHEFMNNDSVSFPAVSCMILNLSNKKVVAKLGNDIIELQPNSRKLIPLSKNKRGSFTDEVVFAAQNKNKSINYFFSSYWRITAGRKILCIIDANEKLDSNSLKEILL
tara:strand:+ start:670 stop:1359 length:690 start_codon:yes stop_codon:yes gene_type:complete